jgi:hypothetical protein
MSTRSSAQHSDPSSSPKWGPLQSSYVWHGPPPGCSLGALVDGALVGALVGVALGSSFTITVKVGNLVGSLVGALVVGALVGAFVGSLVGSASHTNSQIKYCGTEQSFLGSKLPVSGSYVQHLPLDDPLDEPDLPPDEPLELPDLLPDLLPDDPLEDPDLLPDLLFEDPLELPDFKLRAEDTWREDTWRGVRITVPGVPRAFLKEVADLR